jgi:tRNA modification GTPase
MVHEGLTLAIVGRPNVGKSSLFNRLVERERAIVTATPGTTRDLVTETVALAGIPLKLIDTAGIRHTSDEAESIGVRKSQEALSEADMVVVVLDTTQQISEEDREILESARARRALVAVNKSDLVPASAAPELDGFKSVRTSAITGEGVEKLREQILAEISGSAGSEQESGFLTNVRHQRLVEESIPSLDAARLAVQRSVPHEMIMLDLYSALRPLDAITGDTTTDDILGVIFSSFCIGK